jgi:hypothetical protein
MTNLFTSTTRRIIPAITAIGASLCLAITVVAQTQPVTLPNLQPNFQKETPMQHAKGTFDVKVIPVGTEDKAEGTTLGRMSIDKQFHGDLTGTGKGEMLTGMAEVKGSGGYVAIERVTGTLQGRTGSFILQHIGVMTRGEPQLSVTIVPDSGTSQLVGITGKLTITITEGKHFYDLAYTLPEAP